MLQTTIAGSLPKPAWLAEPEQLWAPWKLEGAALDAGKRDAMPPRARDQEHAGIDIVTDGEQTRRHFVHGFIEQSRRRRLRAQKTVIGIRADRYEAAVPIVVGPVAPQGPIHGDERLRRARRPARRSSSRCPAR